MLSAMILYIACARMPSPSTSLRPDFRMLLESQTTLVLLEKDPCPRAAVSSMTP